MGKEKLNISKEEASKAADEIIKQRLQEIAGEGDTIETSDGNISFGRGEGAKIETPIDSESAKIMGVDSDNLGLSGFSSLPDGKKERERSLKEVENTEKSDDIKMASKIELDMLSVEDDEEKIENKVAYDNREDENPVIDEAKSFEKKMEDAGLSKDTAIELILKLTDCGSIKEDISLFGGIILCKVESPKVIDSANFIDMLDEEEMKTTARVEFYLNLFSMAAVLVSYNGKDINDLSLRQKVEWIEVNIPTVIYKGLLPKIQKFHLKIELLSSEEVANFF